MSAAGRSMTIARSARRLHRDAVAALLLVLRLRPLRALAVWLRCDPSAMSAVSSRSASRFAIERSQVHGDLPRDRSRCAALARPAQGQLLHHAARRRARGFETVPWVAPAAVRRGLAGPARRDPLRSTGRSGRGTTGGCCRDRGELFIANVGRSGSARTVAIDSPAPRAAPRGGQRYDGIAAAFASLALELDGSALCPNAVPGRCARVDPTASRLSSSAATSRRDGRTLALVDAVVAASGSSLQRPE